MFRSVPPEGEGEDEFKYSFFYDDEKEAQRRSPDDDSDTKEEIQPEEIQPIDILTKKYVVKHYTPNQMEKIVAETQEMFERNITTDYSTHYDESTKKMMASATKESKFDENPIALKQKGEHEVKAGDYTEASGTFDRAWSTFDPDNVEIKEEA